MFTKKLQNKKGGKSVAENLLWNQLELLS